MAHLPTLHRRRLLAGAATLLAGSVLPVAVRATPSRVFRPEAYGARGDGVRNDTKAFGRLSAAVAAAGGGTIEFGRGRTYRVGVQLPGPAEGWAFEPLPIIAFTGLAGDVVIRGNGATLRCAPGLRYGTFDRATGNATHHAMPFLDGHEAASPYRAMIQIERCTGLVSVSDLELDGGVNALTLGGDFGDTGKQIQCDGLRLRDNRGPERVERVYSHHHGRDGIYIDGWDDDRPTGVESILTAVRSEYNGRQGVSMVGGRRYSYVGSTFAHTGRGPIYSNPCAGVDLEAEADKRVRDVRFTDCSFADNHGPALVADNGDTLGVVFQRCSFIGTTNWSAWPNRPGLRFEQCRFVGTLVHAWGDSDPARATQFVECAFLDDPALTPDGRVYGGENPDRPIADLANNPNALFDRCRFMLDHDSVLPWSTNVTYRDCTMRQVAPRDSYPRGTFLGTTTIAGRAVLDGSTIRGRVVLNGQVVPPSA